MRMLAQKPRCHDAPPGALNLRTLRLRQNNAWVSPPSLWQIAGEAVEELRRYGGWKELDEEAPMRPLTRG